MKKIIRLTESDLHRVIKETISDIYAEIARKKREQMENDWMKQEYEDRLDMDPDWNIEQLQDLENKNIYDMHNKKRYEYPF